MVSLASFTLNWFQFCGVRIEHIKWNKQLTFSDVKFIIAWTVMATFIDLIDILLLQKTTNNMLLLHLVAKSSLVVTLSLRGYLLLSFSGCHHVVWATYASFFEIEVMPCTSQYTINLVKRAQYTINLVRRTIILW